MAPKGARFLNWNPDLHPRGRDGRFIETNGYVRVRLAGPRTKRTERLTGRVIDIVPDPVRPGNPTVKVEVWDPKTTWRTTYSMKPHMIDTVDVKADLSDWTDPLSRLMQGGDDLEVSTVRDPAMLMVNDSRAEGSAGEALREVP